MQEEQNDLKLWRKVQIDKCIKVVLIFMGIIMMQFVAYLICVPIYMGLQTSQGNAIPAGMDKIMEAMLNSESGMGILISMLSALFSMIWCSVLYYKSDWRVRPFSYRKAFSVKNVVGIIGLGFGGCTVLTICLSILVVLFPDAFTEYLKLMQNVDMDNGLITMIYVLLIGPVSEEMIFRGAIMDRLKIAFPFWIANGIQAALFGLYHMNLVQGVYAFVLGMILGLVIQVTGSIWGAIATHILFNSTSSFLGAGLGGNPMEQAVILMIAFVLAIVSFVFGLKHYFNSYVAEPTIEK